MEPSDLEKQLGELEEKIDRLRALYEQYFMGIERLEPLIPRKDVDRRITLLRKEQMRNTALRFRFNTLCQRFNTMQQHWGRIVREIENGTYRRDVARAAARFGVDEALTAVGRKRAAGLQKVLQAQKEVEARRDQEKRRASSEYESLDAADLIEDDDDDAPTPPPLHRGGQPAARPASGSRSVEAGYDAARFAAPAYGEAAGAERFGFAPPPAAARAGGGVDPTAMGFPDVAIPAAGAPGAAASTAASPSPEAPKKAPAGLRLGGGAPRAADPDAARRRLEELAARMGATPPPSPVTPAPRAPAATSRAAAEPPRRRFDPYEIMSVGVPPPSTPPPRPADVAAESSRRPAPGPLGLRPPSGRASSPSLEGQASTGTPGAPTASASSPGAAGAAGPSAADRAAAKRAEVAAAGASRELAEPRVREIYKEFIEAKRLRNESTASITYDKLADSLRKQVDKLKSEHKDRRIDFAVVTKDGKTMIKPIIK